MTPRRGSAKFPAAQSAVIGRNVRALRLDRGWTMAKFGERMGWQTASTVCAAEGTRSSYQRRFTIEEVARLAAIFGVSPEQLNTRCVNCGGQPAAGFACLRCGAATP
jgi:transcriptional regulator with XRE-family HTH domain